MLAFDVTDARREGLLGFAIAREGGNRPPRHLAGMQRFPGQDHAPGAPVSSAVGPIQRFRWSDYAVYPGVEYRYSVRPVYGTPIDLELGDGPKVSVTTASATEGAHRVLFNRAAAASQAFSRDFPEVEAELEAARASDRPPVLPPRALAWLGRGLLEQITGICQRAVNSEWALDIAIYEYELPAIIQAVSTAYERGAQVRIVYHAKSGDEQTAHNDHALTGWPAELRRPRTTSRIFHDKFIVLSHLDGAERTPVAVLCGSTNFTENGVYRQANVTHHVEDDRVATQYGDLFEVLFNGADTTETKSWINDNNQIDADNPVMVGFTPRSGETDLDLFESEIKAAKRDVLFCTAFELNDRIDQALLGAANDEILRLGLQNTRSGITGVHRDRTAEFVASTFVADGIEGHFLKESTAGQRGNILIHTKLVVIDFTSDAPTVISGSHNLSAAASSGNDENFLVLRGLADVADCYGVEAMRLYEHYRFRWRRKQAEETNGGTASGMLATDDSWTDPYFEAGSLARADRLNFGVSPAP